MSDPDSPKTPLQQNRSRSDSIRSSGPSSATALITGAGRRIGRAIAHTLATKGWQIAVHYRRSAAEADALVREITANGGSAQPFQADLTDLGQLEAMVASITRDMAPVTCLINNASEFLHDNIANLDTDTWQTHLDINLKAPVFLTQAVVRHLPADADANIINIIDQRVWRLTPDFFSYTISKAGLWTATRTLAQALAPNIRVNAIGPGPVLRSVHQTEQDFADEVASTLLKAGPTPEEIAAAVCFILSTPSMTGQMIALDGGQHLT